MGQKGESVMRGRGTCKTFCLYWIVLDHRTDKTAPVGLKTTSETHRCFFGSNCRVDGISKFDLRKHKKKAH